MFFDPDALTKSEYDNSDTVATTATKTDESDESVATIVRSGTSLV